MNFFIRLTTRVVLVTFFVTNLFWGIPTPSFASSDRYTVQKTTPEMSNENPQGAEDFIKALTNQVKEKDRIDPRALRQSRKIAGVAKGASLGESLVDNAVRRVLVNPVLIQQAQQSKVQLNRTKQPDMPERLRFYLNMAPFQNLTASDRNEVIERVQKESKAKSLGAETVSPVAAAKPIVTTETAPVRRIGFFRGILMTLTMFAAFAGLVGVGGCEIKVGEHKEPTPYTIDGESSAELTDFTGRGVKPVEFDPNGVISQFEQTSSHHFSFVTNFSAIDDPNLQFGGGYMYNGSIARQPDRVFDLVAEPFVILVYGDDEIQIDVSDDQLDPKNPQNADGTPRYRSAPTIVRIDGTRPYVVITADTVERAFAQKALVKKGYSNPRLDHITGFAVIGRHDGTTIDVEGKGWVYVPQISAVSYAELTNFAYPDDMKVTPSEFDPNDVIGRGQFQQLDQDNVEYSVDFTAQAVPDRRYAGIIYYTGPLLSNLTRFFNAYTQNIAFRIEGTPEIRISVSDDVVMTNPDSTTVTDEYGSPQFRTISFDFINIDPSNPFVEITPANMLEADETFHPDQITSITVVSTPENLGADTGTVTVESRGLEYVARLEPNLTPAALTFLPGSPSLISGELPDDPDDPEALPPYDSSSIVSTQLSSAQFTFDYTLGNVNDAVYEVIKYWVPQNIPSSVTFDITGPADSKLNVQFRSSPDVKASFEVTLTGGRDNFTFEGFPQPISEIVFSADLRNMGPQGTVEVNLLGGLGYNDTTLVEPGPLATPLTVLPANPTLAAGQAEGGSVVTMTQVGTTGFSFDYNLPLLGYGWTTMVFPTPQDLGPSATFEIEGPAGKYLKVQVQDSWGNFINYYVLLTGSPARYTFNGLPNDIREIAFIPEVGPTGSQGTIRVQTTGLGYNNAPLVDPGPLATPLTVLPASPTLAAGQATGSVVTMTRVGTTGFSFDYNLPPLGYGWTTMVFPAPQDLGSSATFEIEGPAGKFLKVRVKDSWGKLITYYVTLTGSPARYTFNGLPNNIREISFTAEREPTGSQGTIHVETSSIAPPATGGSLGASTVRVDQLVKRLSTEARQDLLALPKVIQTDQGVTLLPTRVARILDASNIDPTVDTQLASSIVEQARVEVLAQELAEKAPNELTLPEIGQVRGGVVFIPTEILKILKASNMEDIQDAQSVISRAREIMAGKSLGEADNTGWLQAQLRGLPGAISDTKKREMDIMREMNEVKSGSKEYQQLKGQLTAVRERILSLQSQKTGLEDQLGQASGKSLGSALTPLDRPLKNILIVESDQTTAELYPYVIKQSLPDLETDVVRSFEKAQKYLDKNMSQTDLIITNLGKTLDGREFIKYVREGKRSRVPILITTGGQPLGPEEISSISNVIQFPKPFNLVKFLGAIKDLQAKSRGMSLGGVSTAEETLKELESEVQKLFSLIAEAVSKKESQLYFPANMEFKNVEARGLALIQIDHGRGDAGYITDRPISIPNAVERAVQLKGRAEGLLGRPIELPEEFRAAMKTLAEGASLGLDVQQAQVIDKLLTKAKNNLLDPASLDPYGRDVLVWVAGSLERALENGDVLNADLYEENIETLRIVAAGRSLGEAQPLPLEVLKSKALVSLKENPVVVIATLPELNQLVEAKGHEDLVKLLSGEYIRLVVSDCLDASALPKVFREIPNISQKAVFIAGALTGESLLKIRSVKDVVDGVGVSAGRKIVHISDLEANKTGLEQVMSVKTDFLRAAVISASGDPAYLNAFVQDKATGFWVPTELGQRLMELMQEFLSAKVVAQAA